MERVILKNGLIVNICKSCLKGEHISYGYDHRKGEVDRRDCKNAEGNIQCQCNEDFTELWAYLKERGSV